MLNLTILQDNVPEYINLLVFLNCLEKDNSDYVGTAHAILCYMILLDGSVIVISQVRHGMFPQHLGVCLFLAVPKYWCLYRNEVDALQNF